jgi:quercetin dioxygenase-like cupin family protein
MIVTGIEEDGSSAMQEHFVEELTEYDSDGKPSFKGNLLWGTKDGIGEVGAGKTPEALTAPFFPGPGGHRFVVFSHLPERAAETGRGEAEPPAGVGVGEEQMPGLMEVFDPERPGMHKTDSIDYSYIISGEMYLELDNGEEVLIRQGDTVVQRGTWHAWHNRTDEPCVVACILVGTDRKDD